MEVILLILLFPFMLIGGVIAVSKGECYYCGERLKGAVVTRKGKKWCCKCE